jgi:NADPH-dependent curcumin reductase CurA
MTIVKTHLPQSKTGNRRLVLASRPKGEPTAEILRLETGPVPTPAEGQMLLRTGYQRAAATA